MSITFPKHIGPVYSPFVQHIDVCCCRSKLPHSLEVIYLSMNGGLDLEQWLPALAALPRCHTLGLQYCGNDVWYNDAEFDAMTVRSRLATSPAMQRLYREHRTLPALAAVRAIRGLPHVSVGPAVWEERHQLNVATIPPDVRFRQCALLPSPQINSAPSCMAELCADSDEDCSKFRGTLKGIDYVSEFYEYHG